MPVLTTRRLRKFRVRRMFAGFLAACSLSLLIISGAAAEETITVEAFPGVEFSAEDVFVVLPGDVTGWVRKSDRKTPHAGMRVALIDSVTGDDLAVEVSDSTGEFVYEDVAEGRYVIRAGRPGVLSILDVDPEEEPEEVIIIVSRPWVLPMPGWAPAWMQANPGWSYGAVAGVAAIAGGVIYKYNIRRTDREEVLSPIKP